MSSSIHVCLFGRECKISPAELGDSTLIQCTACSKYFHHLCANQINGCEDWSWCGCEPVDAESGREQEVEERHKAGAGAVPAVAIGESPALSDAGSDRSDPASAAESSPNWRKVIADVKNRILSQGSKTTYLSCAGKMVKWIYHHKPSLLSDDFKKELTVQHQNVAIDRRIMLLMRADIPPIRFDVFKVENLEEYVGYVMTTQSDLRFNSYCSLRAAVRYLFRRYGHSELYQKMENDIGILYKGLNNTITDRIAQQGARIMIGKEALPFELYRYKCSSWIACREPEILFSRLFLILSWNLMSRSVNVAEIMYETRPTSYTPNYVGTTTRQR